MHCTCCDKLLSDYETSITGVLSGKYLDTCKDCLKVTPTLQWVITKAPKHTKTNTTKET